MTAGEEELEALWYAVSDLKEIFLTQKAMNTEAAAISEVSIPNLQMQEKDLSERSAVLIANSWRRRLKRRRTSSRPISRISWKKLMLTGKIWPPSKRRRSSYRPKSSSCRRRGPPSSRPERTWSRFRERNSRSEPRKRPA